MPSGCEDSFLYEEVELNSPESLYGKDPFLELLPKELRLMNGGQPARHPLSPTEHPLKGSDLLGLSDPLNLSMGPPSITTTTTTSTPTYESALSISTSVQGVSNTMVSGVLSPSSLSPLGQSELATQQRQQLSPLSSPGGSPLVSVSDSSNLMSPSELNTSSSLLVSTRKMNLRGDDSSGWMEDDDSSSSNTSSGGVARSITANGQRKSRKVSAKQSPSSPKERINMERLFDADGSSCQPQFEFKKFGADIVSIKARDSHQGVPADMQSALSAPPTLLTLVPTSTVPCQVVELAHVNSCPVPRRQAKEPSLNMPNLSSKHGSMQLKILKQPEVHHRARYMTEGSRGSVKDESGHGFPTVKLEGCNKSATLQVFVGTDTGKIKPHGFYQACKVTGRNTTPCTERDIEGTTVIEVPLDPTNNMTQRCVKNISCKLSLKISLLYYDTYQLTWRYDCLTLSSIIANISVLYVKSAFFLSVMANVLFNRSRDNSIQGAQPTGQPEILKKSLSSCTVAGGEEMFIIGKNFIKGTQVKFQEISEDCQLIWEAEAEIDKEYFHQTHLICTVPPYQTEDVKEAVAVQVVVCAGGKTSEPHTFSYTPLPTVKPPAVLPLKTETGLQQPESCSFEQQLRAMAEQAVREPTNTPLPVAGAPIGSVVTHSGLNQEDVTMLLPPANAEDTAQQTAQGLFDLGELSRDYRNSSPMVAATAENWQWHCDFFLAPIVDPQQQQPQDEETRLHDIISALQTVDDTALSQSIQPGYTIEDVTEVLMKN
ncbi:LOW QUALITY PROTEIN: nuclear factor of activated T-cells 5-like [Branchiostoma floridae]|uniref:LOW QUALITY PROTEIN: nuclear factor of activated T-cells 5-like n=1 Tax=Branchiostoma floridae TaxID=7739 RepID=A0A9J7LBQ8_BRAFL|nr:LOW QUALITY PROTEIN: nuclear factor of activated T-cells 5-like [Branchiostoma floridae]